MTNVIGFADGENLVLRYQDMVKEGRTPRAGTVHVRDLVAWHPDITQVYLCEIARFSFYQTVVGDDLAIAGAKQAILEVPFRYQHTHAHGGGNLAPRVFKKGAREAKTKSVDINLTIDMMRHAANPNFDVLYLLSGDGDYLPLIEEVTRMGKQVWLGAFSKGFNSNLKYAADDFFDLDPIFFSATGSNNALQPAAPNTA